VKKFRAKTAGGMGSGFKENLGGATKDGEVFYNDTADDRAQPAPRAAAATSTSDAPNNVYDMVSTSCNSLHTSFSVDAR
jgi:hypothetical protein